MSSGGKGKDGGATSTNDDAFMTFAFAIVSVVAFVMFVPLLYSAAKEIFAKVKAMLGMGSGKSTSNKSKYADDEHQSVFADGFEDVGTVWDNVRFVVTNPAEAQRNFSAMIAHPRISVRYVLPRFLRFCFRPKVFVLVLWFTLLSSVLYSTLTYDPYSALGLEQTATYPEVKKAYRQLVSINHPDRNKTAEAKQVWPKIQRAYKSITNKEKGVEEEKDQAEEFSVGVALPSWMLQNEKITLLLLIAVLVAVPYFAYRALAQSQDTQLTDIFDSIDLANAEAEKILIGKMGVPADKALRQRRMDRRRIFQAMCMLGVVDETMPEHVAENALPPLKELRVRLQTKNGQSLRDQQRWLTEEMAVRMLQFFNDTDASVERELQAAAANDAPSGNAGANLLTGSALASEAFVLRQIFDSVHRDLEAYSTIIGSATLTAKKMLRLQDAVLDNVNELIKQNSKLNTARIANELLEAPGKFEELCKEMRVMTARFIEQKKQEKQMEMLRDVAMQNGGKLPPQIAQQAMEAGLIPQQGGKANKR